MLSTSSGRAGARPIKALVLLAIVTLSLMVYPPDRAESTTLAEGLGPVVETTPLPG